MDEDDLHSSVNPLLWQWTRTVLLPPFLPPPDDTYPLPPYWPFPPQWPQGCWWIGAGPFNDGNLVLRGTEALLADALSPESIHGMSDEIGRWSRSSAGNADRLGEMQEGFRRFQDECSKLPVQRENTPAGHIAAGSTLALLLALGVFGCLI